MSILSYPLNDEGLSVYDLQSYLARAGSRARRSHRHDFWQCIRFSDEGVHHVDLRQHDYMPGSILLLPPGAVHRFEEGESQGTLLHFPSSLLARSEQDSKRILQLRAIAIDAPFYSPAGEDGEKIHELLSWLDAESQRTQQDVDFQQALLHALLLLLLRHPGNTGTADPERNDYWEFLNLVEARYRERPPIPEYARALQLSTKRLYTVTMSAAGVSPGQVVNRRLLLEAKRRLVHSDEPISAIAFDLGFPDPAYFTRFFKKQAGQSPRAFRGAQQTAA